MKRQLTKSFWVDDEKRTGEIRFSGPVQVLEKPTAQAPKAKTGEASQFSGNNYFGSDAATEISKLPASEILPREEDLYFLTMRAISQKLIDGYWIDYTRPGVLEASVSLLNKQRICVDHYWWKAESAIGAITDSVWDAEGANSNGLPGINIRFFVDSKIAPGIVRRLAYPVPAIHSGSVTVGFEWEPSHPRLMDEDKFWWAMGEEVEGSIVRLIVTRILFYREFSLVYEGADSDAKRLPDEPMTNGEDDDDMKRKKDGMYSAPTQPPKGGITNEETKTVKLTAEQKKLLGLESHAGDDVPDAAVLTAVEQAAPRIAAADQIISAERAEVLRLATLAEVGAEGQLPEALAAIIQQADASQLPKLKQMYIERGEKRFGVKPDGTARSSQEEPPTEPKQTQQQAQPERMPYL